MGPRRAEAPPACPPEHCRPSLRGTGCSQNRGPAVPEPGVSATLSLARHRPHQGVPAPPVVGRCHPPWASGVSPGPWSPREARPGPGQAHRLHPRPLVQPALHHRRQPFLRAPRLASFALTLLTLIFFVVPRHRWIYPVFFPPARPLLPGKAPRFVIARPVPSATGNSVKAVAAGGAKKHVQARGPFLVLSPFYNS